MMISKLHCVRYRPRPSRRAFTLVEMLTATALALLMMAMLASVFGQVTESINKNRATIEMRSQLRGVADRLRQDLEGVTAPMVPPLDPASGFGYFEYIEGAFGPIYHPADRNPVGGYTLLRVQNTTDSKRTLPADSDIRLGDHDDILMFTTQSKREPFLGLHQSVPPGSPNPPTPTITYHRSDTAEVAWFVRGTTLYRRVLLVGAYSNASTTRPSIPTRNLQSKDANNNTIPNLTLNAVDGSNFYQFYDVSVHMEGGTRDGIVRTNRDQYLRLVPNTLGDLTNRQNRFSHQPFQYRQGGKDITTYESRHWTQGQTQSAENFPAIRFWGPLGLPTLAESSCWDPYAPNSQTLWRFPYYIGSQGNSGSNPVRPRGVPSAGLTYNNTASNLRTNPLPSNGLHRPTGLIASYPDGTRAFEDAILTNVLAFDVKIWDPAAPIWRTATSGAIGDSAVLPGDPNYLSVMADSITNSRPAIGFGAYVDLNYMSLLGPLNSNSDGYWVPNYTFQPPPFFHGPGNPSPSTTYNTCAPASVFDTWSTQGERDGLDQDGNGRVDTASDGIDNNLIGGVDDYSERECPPPYPGQCAGIQVTIRVWEPDSEQVREVTVVQDFISE